MRWLTMSRLIRIYNICKLFISVYRVAGILILNWIRCALKSNQRLLTVPKTIIVHQITNVNEFMRNNFVQSATVFGTFPRYCRKVQWTKSKQHIIFPFCIWMKKSEETVWTQPRCHRNWSMIRPTSSLFLLTVPVWFHCCSSLYSRTSMARTSLEPWKFVRDMGNSSHWGLIMAPVQEANSDNLGKSFRFFYTMIVCWVYSLESLWWGDSNEYTQHTIPW